MPKKMNYFCKIFYIYSKKGKNIYQKKKMEIRRMYFEKWENIKLKIFLLIILIKTKNKYLLYVLISLAILFSSKELMNKTKK